MASIWRVYLRALEKRPFVTQVSSTAILMASGDVIAQFAVEKKGIQNYEPSRTVRFFGFGIFVGGPILRTWYIILDKVYKGTGTLVAAKKLATDQLCFAPAFLTVFVSVMGLLRGDSQGEIKDKLKRDFKPILITNYKIWPLVQAINFYFVPLQHRIIVVNFVALGWNTYLAWVAEQKLKHVKDEGVLD